MPMSWWNEIEVDLDSIGASSAPNTGLELYLHDVKGNICTLTDDQVADLLESLDRLDAPPELDWGGYGGGHDVSTNTLHVLRDGREYRFRSTGSFDNLHVEKVWDCLYALLDETEFLSIPINVKLTRTEEAPVFELPAQSPASGCTSPFLTGNALVEADMLSEAHPSRSALFRLPGWPAHKRWWLITPVVIAILFLSLYLAGGYLVYDRLTTVTGLCQPHRPNMPEHFTNISEWPEFDMTPYFMPSYEDVRFPSRETDYEIAGWYVVGDPDKPAVILVDGIGGCRHAQAVLVPAGMLWRNGFNVLLIDLHETGDSQIVDRHSTLGSEEYLDVLGAWDWLREVQGFAAEEIGMAANSLGAATSLYAFAEEPQTAAIFLNSPYANLPQILKSELSRSGFPTILVRSAMLMGRIVTGVNVLERTPLDAMAVIGERPVFVVHSIDDKRIAIDHSYQLQDAALRGNVDFEFWFIDKVDHVRGPAVYPEEYEDRLVGFFERTLR